MSVEAEQLSTVADIAARHGVLVHHCRDSRHCTGDPGFPDLILVGPAGCLYRELKTSLRSITPDQTTWRWTLDAAGANVAVWLPSHFRNGTVEAQIAALARV